MQRFFIGGLFLLCAAGTGWNGIVQIGLYSHCWLGYGSVAVALISGVYLCCVEDLILEARRERAFLARRDLTVR